MIIDSLNPKKEKKVKRKRTKNFENKNEIIQEKVEITEKKKININIYSEKEIECNDPSNTIEQENNRKSKNLF